MTDKEALLKDVRDSIQKYCEAHHGYQFDPAHPAVRLHEPTVSTDEIFAATETMLSTFTTMGKRVRAFENMFAEFTGTKHCLMSNSGSSANLLAIGALANPVTGDHLRPGDEVIVPALSWSTTIWPLTQHNLLPVFVDCSLDDLNLDIDKLEEAIGPKTRAITLVHVYGNPCNMDAIVALVRKHNLWLIEDSCEAMGASYKGKSVGSFGHVGNFSLFFSHHISTLEGGLSVANDFDLVETMRILRAHGWSREADEHKKYVDMYPEIDPRFLFINTGYNLRPTEVNGAIGFHQLPKLMPYINTRQEVAAYYIKRLAKYDNLFRVQAESAGNTHAWFGFTIILHERAPFTLKDITTYMQARGIETRPIIAGNMARHPAFNLVPHRIAGDLTSADTVMKRGFAVPCHHAVDACARAYVMDTIDAFMSTQKLAFTSASVTKGT